MSDKILTAIKNLPKELITAEIAAAGIAEGKIELLDHLPHKYLTADIVLSLITSDSSYSWDGFQLESIPEKLRSDKVCEKAVSVKMDNIRHVPQELLTSVMLCELVDKVPKSIKYLNIIPIELWNIEHIYKGILRVKANSYSSYSYGRSSRNSSSTYDNSACMKMLQVFFSFVPRSLMNKDFYRGLFTAKTGLPLETIDAITPTRYKDLAYYSLICKQDFNLVPEKFYNYTIFRTALAEDSATTPYYLFDKDKIKNKLLEVMDDEIANRIVIKKSTFFTDLPQKFKTANRLVLAIENFSGNYYCNIAGSEDLHPHLLTDKVCRAFVKQNKDYPKFPAKIWTSKFVDYCLKHGTSLDWLKQMPQHFQTKDMVAGILNKSMSRIQYCLPEFISLEQAEKAHRHGEYTQKHVPEHFYTEFMEQTGLQKEFFGGQVSFSELRDTRKSKTYTQLGDNFIGVYKLNDNWNACLRLIVTRRTPHSIQPTTIFDRTIGTFHTTWLEKMIADYDQSFQKPTISKAFKEFQMNGYYEVVKSETYNDVQIYQNRLFDDVAQYSAKINGYTQFANSIAELKTKIDKAVAKLVSDEQLVAV